jgi:type IV secretion system protein VirB5
MSKYLSSPGPVPQQRPVRPRLTTALAGSLLLGAFIPVAQAQFAVIDVASVTQLVQEVQTLAQELATLRSQLTQAQALYQSMTGGRGMQRLLSGSSPNYLPDSWPQLLGSMQGGSGAYPALSAGVQAAVAANAVLSGTQLSALGPAEQGLINAERQTIALSQGLSQQALPHSSASFSDVQQLANAIGSTSDEKSILELQATLAAEQGLLQNEQTKLQVSYEATASQRWALAERQRELTIAAHGRFATRFEPSP